MNALRLVVEDAERQQSGNAYAAKLSAADVKEIRRFATQEGFGLLPSEQVRRLRLSGFPAYVVKDDATLRNVLINESFHDPAYDRHTPDPGWGDTDAPPVPMRARVHWPTPPKARPISDEEKWEVHDEQLRRIEMEVAGNPVAAAHLRALRAVHRERRGAAVRDRR